MRCYDGCPDSELQALLDYKQSLRKRLAQELGGATVTYFPAEGKYMAFNRNHRSLSDFHEELDGAVHQALREHGGRKT